MNKYQIKTQSKAHFNKIITVLFSLGYDYGVKNCKTVEEIDKHYTYYPYIVIGGSSKPNPSPMELHGALSGTIYFDFPLITLDNFLALPEPINDIQVNLNNDYTAVISQDGIVTVGCQKFPFDVIDKVANAVSSMRLRRSLKYQ